MIHEKGKEDEVVVDRWNNWVFELDNEYNFDFGVGITYTFGSIYDNVVNPRFGD